MRLMTWNMQGGNDGKFSLVANFMKKHKIQVACLQETGTLPKQYVDDTRTVNNVALSLGTFSTGSRSGFLSVVNFDNDLGRNNRCSLAIFCEEAILDYDVIAAPANALRPLIGIKIPGDRWIYSIHAPASGGAAGTASAMLNNIPAGRNWVVLGDFNCDPSSMRSKGFTVTSGGSPTQQSGGTLDYAVSSNITLSHASSLDSLTSDHYSQVFDS